VAKSRQHLRERWAGSVARSYWPYALLLCPVIAVLAVFPRWTVDDAFITFRYAHNLAHHGQLTWNVGEDPVEGYTGILMPALLAAANRLGYQPEQAAHVIGVLSLLLCVVGFVIFLERCRVHRLIVLGSATLLVTSPFLYTHALSGLETMLFASLLILSFGLIHEIVVGRERAVGVHARLAFLLLLLALTRPEGAALALFAPSILLARAREHHLLRRVVPAYVLLLYLPGLAYFLWRLSYYGFALPNTFYVKALSGGSISSIRSLYHFGRDYLLAPAVASFAVLLLLRKGRESGAGRSSGSAAASFGIFGLFSGIVVAFYSVSTLTMNFSHRFFAPFYPVALASLASLAGRALDQSNDVSRGITLARKVSLSIVIAGLALQLSLNARWMVREELPYVRGYSRLLASEHIPIGGLLRNRIPASEWLVVYFDAGAIPYVSGLRTLDFGSLNDEYLAHSKKLTAEDRTDYLFSKNAGALVFTSFAADRPDRGPAASQELAGRITKDPRFGSYVLLRRYDCAKWPNYYEFVYVRSDLLGSEDAARKELSSGGRLPPIEEVAGER
jgi:hypothetical protein